MPLDLSNDHEIFDGLEEITYFRQLNNRGDGFDIGTTITHALRRAVALNELAAAQLLSRTVSVIWHIPANQLQGGDVPTIGDAILDASGQTWRVNDVFYETLQSRWRCATVKENVPSILP